MDTVANRTTPKKRLSAAHWQAIMARFDASGVTQEAFCRQESLAISTFNKWRKQLKQAPYNSTVEPMFVDLASLSAIPDAGGWDIELVLGDGVTLRLRRS